MSNSKGDGLRNYARDIVVDSNSTPGCLAWSVAGFVRSLFRNITEEYMVRQSVEKKGPSTFFKKYLV